MLMSECLLRYEVENDTCLEVAYQGSNSFILPAVQRRRDCFHVHTRGILMSDYDQNNRSLIQKDHPGHLSRAVAVNKTADFIVIPEDGNDEHGINSGTTITS